MSQSTYLFLEKFKGVEGLIKYLKTSYGKTKLLQFNEESIHYRKTTVIQDAKDTKGILADPKDLDWRRNSFGSNLFPSFKTKSVSDLIWLAFSD